MAKLASELGVVFTLKADEEDEQEVQTPGEDIGRLAHSLSETTFVENEHAEPDRAGNGDPHEQLDADTGIVARMTLDLLANPPRQLTTIEVVNERGTVTLKGQVDSPDVRERAEGIAARHPGVSQVVNVLEVGAGSAWRTHG